MKRYIDMTRDEMEDYKKSVGFFYSATVIWEDTDGRKIPSDYDCTTIKELNECLERIKENKKVVYMNRFIRHLGGKYRKPDTPQSSVPQKFLDSIKQIEN